MTDVEYATVREWTDICARARFGTVQVAGKKVTAASIKAVAGRLAAYADSDGTRVRPGIARVAVDLELSYDVVKRAVRHLTQLGLLRLVRSGARAGHADEYRLAIPVDLLERLEVWTPAQHRLEVERVREQTRGRRRRTPERDPDPSDVQVTPSPAHTEPDAPGAGDTVTCTPVDNSPVQVTQSPAPTLVDDERAGDTGTCTDECAGDTGSAVQVTQSPATYQRPSHKTDLPLGTTHRLEAAGSAHARADPQDPKTQPADTTPSAPPALRLVETVARNPLRRRDHVAEQIAAATARREAARLAHQGTTEETPDA